MTWTTPPAKAVDDTLTATNWNTHVKGNLEHVRQTHGPISLPANIWAPEGATLSLKGTDPDRLMHLNFADAADTEAHIVIPVPSDWISGGFTPQVHFTCSTTTAGNFRMSLRYAFVSTGEAFTAARSVITVTVASPAVVDTYNIGTLTTTSAPTAGDIMIMSFRRPASSDVLDTTSATLQIPLITLDYV